MLNLERKVSKSFLNEIIIRDFNKKITIVDKIFSKSMKEIQTPLHNRYSV